METAALCKPIQRFADLLRIPDTWVLTGLGKLLAALGSFPHFPQPLRLLHTHLYWRFLECQSIEVTLTQNGHLTHHEIPSVASLRPGGHFPRIGWPVSPEYAGGRFWRGRERMAVGERVFSVSRVCVLGNSGCRVHRNQQPGSGDRICRHGAEGRFFRDPGLLAEWRFSILSRVSARSVLRVWRVGPQQPGTGGRLRGFK